MKVYVLGARAFDMLKQARGGYDLQALAVDGIMALQKATGRNVSVAVMDGDFVFVLRAFDAGNNFSGHSRLGLREPLHVRTAGKALVAYLPDALFDARFERYDFASRTPHTIATLATFRGDLATLRANGMRPATGKNMTTYAGSPRRFSTSWGA